MGNIRVLDCTLRDGGYINKANFGEKNIRALIKYLNEANIEVIECGYMYDNLDYDKNKSDFQNVGQVDPFLIDGSDYTVMLSGMKYKIDELPPQEGRVSSIRVAFKKSDLDKIEKFAEEINKKGYKLFLQPQVIMEYTDEEIIDMLKRFNKLDVECVSIVDTFGQMTLQDVEEKTKLFDKYLRKDINIGLHLHNNLQTAFSNAMMFLDTVEEDRNVVIDSSILGMGRGAGNLPTELIVAYLNNNYNKSYKIEPLLEAADSIISKIKEEHYWGYSLPYCLSAMYGVHPSYILLFLERKTLNSNDIKNLINMIPNEKKSIVDKEFAKELYRTYNDRKIDDTESRKKLKGLLKDKKIVLVGPGKSTLEYKEQIEEELSKDDTFSIAVNGNDLFYTDATFYSNKKRHGENCKKDNLTLLTSNIKTTPEEDELLFDYNNRRTCKENK